VVSSLLLVCLLFLVDQFDEASFIARCLRDRLLGQTNVILEFLACFCLARFEDDKLFYTDLWTIESEESI